MTKNNNIKLSEFLPYRLSILSNRISRAIEASYKGRFNLSIAEWRVMAIVADEEGLSANEVAERGEMDKVAVSRAVSKLTKAKRLTRKLTDDDKRKSALFLTPAGQAVYAEIVPIAKGYEADVLGQLSSDDQIKLGDILRKLAKIHLPHRD